ncbi:NAD(P)/FAD-dependent oxidoreductase [Microbacterium sp. SYP-A9085]|uniref:protoporphyrinogen/coproporphyrinogen oxidase n=1 Tax=Microbacterium sp. SYP-A9085 TaxID=2664454 RepID=UPI0034646942
MIGGGIAGLVAARTCLLRGRTVTVLEAGATFGGSVARHNVAGLVLDAGAESFATRGGAVAGLIDELGLADSVEWPNAAGAWLHLADRTVPMPRGGLLGIPVDPTAPDVVAAIGEDAARRARRDLTEPLSAGFAPATLGALVRERMGQAVLDRLVSPVATGVYSTAADDLAVDAIAPGLRSALERTGSLARAVAELRAVARPGSAAGGLRGGMAALVEALVADIIARGGRLVTRSQVPALTRAAGGGWDVLVSAGNEIGAARPRGRNADLADAPAGPHDGVLHADAVIIATAQPDAVRLLSGAVASDAGLLPAPDAWPAPTRVDLATLVLDAPDLDAAPRGTGLLVAEDAHARVAAKALTHATAKWAWLAEAAGPARHVVRLSYGQTGHVNPAQGLNDDALRALALRDAATLLGVPLDSAQVTGFARAVWTNAVSLAARGQAARVDAVRTAVAATPDLEATGAWIAGTGLASVVPDAQAAASRLV